MALQSIACNQSNSSTGQGHASRAAKCDVMASGWDTVGGCRASGDPAGSTGALPTAGGCHGCLQRIRCLPPEQAT